MLIILQQKPKLILSTFVFPYIFLFFVIFFAIFLIIKEYDNFQKITSSQTTSNLLPKSSLDINDNKVNFQICLNNKYKNTKIHHNKV